MGLPEKMSDRPNQNDGTSNRNFFVVKSLVEDVLNEEMSPNPSSSPSGGSSHSIKNFQHQSDAGKRRMRRHSIEYENHNHIKKSQQQSGAYTRKSKRHSIGNENQNHMIDLDRADQVLSNLHLKQSRWEKSGCICKSSKY